MTAIFYGRTVNWKSVFIFVAATHIFDCQAAPADYAKIVETADGVTWSAHPEVIFRTLATKTKRSPLKLALASVWMEDRSGSFGTKVAYKCEEPDVSFVVWHSESGALYRDDRPTASVRGTTEYALWDFACVRAKAGSK